MVSAWITRVKTARVDSFGYEYFTSANEDHPRDVKSRRHFHSSADTMVRSRALTSLRGSPRGVVGEHTCRVNRHLSSFMGNSVGPCRDDVVNIIRRVLFIFLLLRLSVPRSRPSSPSPSPLLFPRNRYLRGVACKRWMQNYLFLN